MTEQRLYVNSFMMRTPGIGDDTEFEVDLGGNFEFNEISMDQAIIENSFCNFYQSWDNDFRVIGVTIAGTTYQVKVDQHVTWDQLINLFNYSAQAVAGNVVVENVANQIDDGKRVL